MDVSRVSYKKLLVPLDGSGFAEMALPHAIDISHRMGASVVLVRVLPPVSLLLPLDATTIIDLEALKSKAREEAEMYIRSRAGELRQMNVPAKGLVVEGIPVAEQILNVATAEGVDLIVMTTHGRSGLGRWVYGSVARQVLLNAPMPVLLVPARE
ncbi:MAG: universal stress protein [Chloroflexi bacterium]|nr:universal stress protein [Chloroflexota bacterium]